MERPERVKSSPIWVIRLAMSVSRDPSLHRRGRRRDSPRDPLHLGDILAASAAVSAVSGINASSRLSRVNTVRRSPTPRQHGGPLLDIALDARLHHDEGGRMPSWISRAPEGRKLATSRPMPRACAASANLRIGRIWPRRKMIARLSSTSDELTMANRNNGRVGAWARAIRRHEAKHRVGRPRS